MRRTLLFLCAALVLALLYFFVIDTKEKEVLYENPVPATLYVDRPLSVAHTFQEGTHIFKGSIQVPTPCHTLLSEAHVLESFPEQIVLVFEIKQESEECIQVISEREFSLSVQASEQATTSAQLNGERLEVELIQTE